MSAGPLAAWKQLLERSRNAGLQPMEQAELLERAALASVALGEWTVGRELYRRALEHMQQNPTLIDERMSRRLDPTFSEPPSVTA